MWHSNTAFSSLEASAVISESLRNEFDDRYPVLGAAFAHETICVFNSCHLSIASISAAAAQSDAGMSQRRRTEPDCSTVIAFISLHQYNISPVKEIPTACTAWSTLQISS